MAYALASSASMLADLNTSISKALTTVSMATFNMSINDTSVSSNCSNETSSLADDMKVINRSLTPIIYALGFPGNILSYLIWIRPRMRHSSGVYLSALAVTDFIFLLLHLCFELNTVWDVSVLTYPVICEIFPIVYFTFQYLAPLLTLAFTIERYISICHPFKRERFCTTRRAQIVSCSLAGGSLLMSVIQGYFWGYSNNDCNIRAAVLVGGNNSFWNIWSWVSEMLIFLVVPGCVLMFNILVIRETKRLSAYEQNQLHGHNTKASATTIMLLAVSFYLIVTTLPVSIVYASVLNFDPGPECASNDTHPTWRRYYTYLLWRTVIEEIGITHYALNFYISILTGKIFRKELKKMFLELIGKPFPEKIRTEYTSLRGSFRNQVMKPTAVRVSANGTATSCDVNGSGSGGETHF